MPPISGLCDADQVMQINPPRFSPHIGSLHPNIKHKTSQGELPSPLGSPTDSFNDERQKGNEVPIERYQMVGKARQIMSTVYVVLRLHHFSLPFLLQSVKSVGARTFGRGIEGEGLASLHDTYPFPNSR